MNFHQYHYNKPFKLEKGQTLENLTIAYHTAGKINEKKDNIIWVCHALTANSNVFDWWAGLFGQNDLFNPEEYFIICANVLGSNYGTTNPLSKNTKTDFPYYSDFPLITIRDMANAHQILAESLGIDKIKVLIGGSLGGQQALELALLKRITIKNLVLLTTNAIFSPWGKAFNESQRLAIEADSTYYENKEDGGKAGLIAARSIALLSYRTYDIYDEKQKDSDSNSLDGYKSSSYQKYQGEKLVNRFNAYSYWTLTKAMDSHNITRNRSSLEEVLKSITIKTKVIGICSDLLFPPKEQKTMVTHMPNATYYEIESVYGHDGFLVEIDQIKTILKDLV